MTIRKRLTRSNLIMILIPVAIAAARLLLGGGLAVLLLKRVYLLRLGLSMAALHETGEQLEAAFDGAKTIAAIYGGTVILALLAAIGFTNLYLTKHLFRHIQKPLDILVSGVKRMQERNLDAPIGYVVPDEFKPTCDAVDEMAARLKTSLEAQSRQQQQKQELIAGMSHDLKSPLTSIRAYTEALLDGVAQDEPYTEGKPTESLSNLQGSAQIQYPYTVPDGCVFCMGDNRTNSLDSRYFGPVSVDAVSSKGLFIYWPLTDVGPL